MAELVIAVYGTPAPQGSKTRLAHGGMVESSKAVRPWREAVKWAVLDAIEQGEWSPTPGPVLVVATFTMARPQSHTTSRGALRASAPRLPATRPDLDKLVRSTLDGIADSGAIADDSRVVALTAAKVYPGGDGDALDTPGALILMRAL